MYTLYSLGTPNNLKPTIMLEELEAPYELEIIPVIYDPEMDLQKNVKVY